MPNSMTPRVALVLDVDGQEGRKLAETIEGAGFEPRRVDQLIDFVEQLANPDCYVGVIAYDALWPEPQKALRLLREQTQGKRLVVAYAENGPRLRLGQRLWSLGLLDYFVPRSTPPHDLRPVLRQAYADAVIDESAAGGTPVTTALDANWLYTRIRYMQSLGSAFTNQRKIDGLLRELQIKLPLFIDYQAFVVLVAESVRHRLYVFPAQPIEHQRIWELAESVCTAASTFLDHAITPEELEFIENAPAGQGDETEYEIDSTRYESVTFPMVLYGELVGCISILLAKTERSESERQIILQVITQQLCASLRNAQQLETAETQSLTDELTGAHNRRYLRRILRNEWSRAQRYKSHLSLVMVDIDHFKAVNDKYGHVVGDGVLRGLVSIIRQNLRDCDHLVRYGGEEFLLVLPETNQRGAALVIERVRILLKRIPVFSSERTGGVQITFSAGIASYTGAASSQPEETIELADRAVYAAKESGRDRVCLAPAADGAREVAPMDPKESKRRDMRIDSSIAIKYVELPSFEGRSLRLNARNMSASGLAVEGDNEILKHNSYALVYIEEDEKPILSRVVWAKDTEHGKREAGLQFMRGSDFQRVVRGSTGSYILPKALVISSNKTMTDLIMRVLRAADYEAQLVDDPQSDLLNDKELSAFSLLVIGQSVLRSKVGERIGALRQRGKSAIRIVVINESADRAEALDTIRSGRVDHLVASDHRSEEVLFATLRKLLLGEYFGIKKYLLWGADTKAWTVANSDEKSVVLEGIRKISREVECHPRIADLVVAAVDEMVINAIYRTTTAINDKTAKSGEERAEEKKHVTVECGSDGRLLAVAVLDEYGLFRHEDLYNSIGLALEREEKGLPFEASQASLGFRIMLSALSQLSINVDPGVCTEIIGIVDLKKSLREYRQAVPTLGMFSRE